MPIGSIPALCLFSVPACLNEGSGKEGLTICLSDQAICLFDQEHDPLLRTFGDLELVPGLPDQIGDIDYRQRIGAMHFQKVAGLQRLQRLSRLQGGQRTFESGEVEFRRGHAVNMARPVRIVNASYIRLA